MKLEKTVIEGKLGAEIYVTDLEEDGYTAYFESFPNVITQGETITEAQDNLWKLLYDVIKYFLDKEKKFDISKSLNAKDSKMSLEEQLKKVHEEKIAAVHEQSFEKAADLHMKEKELLKEIEKTTKNTSYCEIKERCSYWTGDKYHHPSYKCYMPDTCPAYVRDIKIKNT